MRVLHRDDREDFGTHALAFSPDGTRLAAGCAFLTPGANTRGEALYWDLAAGRGPLILLGARNLMKAVAFRPDGRLLAVGAGDRTVRLWDIATEKEVGRLKGLVRPAAALAFAPDGSLLVSASNDASPLAIGGEVLVWRTDTWELLTNDHFPANAWSAVFTPGGRHALVGVGTTVRFWDAARRQFDARVLENETVVREMALSADGRTLAVTAGWDAALWDLESGTRRVRFRAHAQGTRCLVMTPDGRRLISGGDDRTVRCWDLTEQPPRELAAFDWAVGKAGALALSPDGLRVAVGGSSVVLWDLDG